MKKTEESEERGMSLKEIIERAKDFPQPKTIWAGIVEGSFGFIYGPSKSGKTIICENLGLSLACGRKSFMGLPLPDDPKKVLFISLEEQWHLRTIRNSKQLIEVSEEERTLMESNFLVAPPDFLRFTNSKEEWQRLYSFIKNTDSSIVIIDSLTRLTGGIEESDSSRKVMSRLQDISRSLELTLIVIHHSTKLGDRRIDRDSMAGSRVLAQEADFMIAINKTVQGSRYLKPVLYRYADDNVDDIISFGISSKLWVENISLVPEYQLFQEQDGRFNTKNVDLIYKFINENGCCEAEIIANEFVPKKVMSRKTVFNALKKLTNDNKVTKENGSYCLSGSKD